MPWDGAFPIGRGRGGRGPRAGLPGACPLAASRAPRWAPALGRGARRAGRGRGPRRGGPAGRAPAAGRVGTRARAGVSPSVRERVCMCVCVRARAGAGAGVSLRPGARAARARAYGWNVQRASGVAGSREGRGPAPLALQLHCWIPRLVAGQRMRGALRPPAPLHLLLIP